MPVDDFHERGDTIYAGTPSGLAQPRFQEHTREPGYSGVMLAAPHELARAQCVEFSRCIANSSAEPLGTGGAAKSMRQTLGRMTHQQFAELRIDVYDELLRRRSSRALAVPCLPVREDMHEKRNEAREKLSALSSHRFVQLVDDVLRELVGRYPELNVQTGDGRI
ncbi:hypothetical protein FOMPIDRAFT_1021664 [Fomitopsis schrenkii]|uniref:GIT Spa2 homology (SHD) domain-containing protein n=1 Tax=Fomitopsis schrenkii TaxID=2126942 RepID=S8G3K4_FOMSC|nr:hypothetical protein FOMPIDRAFT_1021664 [Fomitopsis schrenkii]